MANGTFNELTSGVVNNTRVTELKLNDAVISNLSELSNAFNDHFSTIGPRLGEENSPIANNKFSFSSINCSTVFLHKFSLLKQCLLLFHVIRHHCVRCFFAAVVSLVSFLF